MLRQEKLTGMIQEFLPEQLVFKTSGILPARSVVGETATWDIETTPRGKLGFQGNGSPAKPLSLNGIKQKTARLGRIFVSKNLQAAMWQNIRQPGSEAEQMAAQQQIAREEREFASAFDRTEEFLISSAIQGKIEGVKVDDLEIDDIDYGMPAGNIFAHNEANPDLNCGDWLDESTNIPDAVRKIKLAVRRATGYALKRAYISDEIQVGLLQNDTFKTYMAQTAAGQRAMEEGSLGRFMGLDWFPVDHVFIDDDGSTEVPYIPANLAVFTPAPSEDWGYLQYGSELIPNDARTGFKQVLGRYSFATMQDNPPGLTLFAGYRLLPIIRKPGALAKATVTAA
ncbi:MAG: major capsid protein [Vicinamibacteria bacterium]